MHIHSIESEPFHFLRFINAARGGGTVVERLPFLRATADRLPDALDALVLTADLQGVAPSWRHGGENILLGCAVAEALVDLAEVGTIPDPARTGVVLAGDLYSAPAGDKRGASGDVREVWLAFAAVNRWVVGVAGNHDRFGSEADARRLVAEPAVDLLDGDIAERDGLRMGGVSYIIGNPMKPGRRDEEEFLTAVEMVAEQDPDIVLLHQGPDGGSGQRGNPYVRGALDTGDTGLVVCGHVHWTTPMARLAGGRQVINVDSRVVVVTRG